LLRLFVRRKRLWFERRSIAELLEGPRSVKRNDLSQLLLALAATQLLFRARLSDLCTLCSPSLIVDPGR
jgi:hypothetical protein